MKSSTRLVLSFSLMAPLLGGCVTSKAYEQPARVYQSTSPEPTAIQSVPRGYEPAKPVAPSAATFSQQQLDSLLAPIALYPDSLLSHILIASTYPLEVIEAERWTRNNTRLQGEDAVKAVEKQNWDPSIKALVAFPDVLKRMSEDLDWTQQLGDAFLEDEGRVMDSIQNLRDKAYASGHLKDTDHVKVVREDRVIMIEPAVERVVYVPVYDTRVVYGPWWWVDYPPVYWHRYSHQVYFSGSFYWGPRVYIGPSFHYSSCHWSNRRVVIVDHHYYNDYYHHRHNYYRSARAWNHNPVHRRGVAYYNEPVRARYSSNREPTRNAWDERQRSRDRAGVISVNPNRDQQADRQINRERNNIIRGSQRADDNSANSQVYANRSDALRARLASRQQESRPATTTTTTTETPQMNRFESRQDITRQRNESRQTRFSNEQTTDDNNYRSRIQSDRSNNESSTRQIIRNTEDNSARINREPRMDNSRQERMESRRSGGSDEGGGRRINRD
jgi:Protein of unknown function (DUF3300)